MALNQYPLVSIIIITYNSEKYVLDTLESAKNQTYLNKELIITDDGSRDNTVSIVNEWLINNKSFFKDIRIISVDGNTGVAANCNRGCKSSKGEYIKIIAGDDILLNDCIEQNINLTLTNDFSILFSKTIIFYDDNITECYKKKILGSKFYVDSFNEKIFSGLKPLDQFKMLCYGCTVSAPTSFIKRSVLKNLGWFDESLSVEDYPFWLKATYSGIKLHYLNYETVMYRVNNQSISFGENRIQNLGNSLTYNLMKKEKSKYFSLSFILKNPFFSFDYYLTVLIDEASEKYKSVKFILKSLKMFSPYYYFRKTRKFFKLKLI